MSITSIDDHRGRKPATPKVPRERSGGPDHPFAINVLSGNLPEMAAIAWDAMEADNDPPQWFRVGRVPIRLVSDEGSLTIPEPLSIDALRGISARNAFWFKEKADGFHIQFPVMEVIKDMLAAAAPPLPPLNRVIYAPVAGADGSISVTPGYNQSTRNYYADAGFVVAAPKEAPSRRDVDAAKSLILDDLLGDFPFTSNADRAHAVSLLLNPFVRDLIGGVTPLYLIEAPTAGTGKGLLAEVTMIPALGRMPTLLSPAEHSEEFRKGISSALFDIPEAILIDNVPDGLDSPHLASALTIPEWTGRILGKTVNRTVPVRCTWMATGNNPTLSAEMDRRVIKIRLDAKTERPEERERFRHRDLILWAKQHRGELVSACLTLVQAWVARGMPQSDHVLGSYGEWARIHGGILQVIGVDGFLANRAEGRAIRVTVDAAWTSLVELWWEAHAESIVSVRDLYQLTKSVPELPIDGKGERGMQIAFGTALKRYRDRIFGGRQIEHIGTRQGAALYRLTETGEVIFQ